MPRLHRASPWPLILSARGSIAVTIVFIALLGWVVIETQGGRDLGLAERLTSSVETTWPFVVAVALRRGQPRLATPGPRRQVLALDPDHGFRPPLSRK